MQRIGVFACCTGRRRVAHGSALPTMAHGSVFARPGRRLSKPSARSRIEERQSPQPSPGVPPKPRLSDRPPRLAGAVTGIEFFRSGPSQSRGVSPENCVPSRRVDPMSPQGRGALTRAAPPCPERDYVRGDPMTGVVGWSARGSLVAETLNAEEQLNSLGSPM